MFGHVVGKACFSRRTIRNINVPVCAAALELPLNAPQELQAERASRTRAELSPSKSPARKRPGWAGAKAQQSIKQRVPLECTGSGTLCCAPCLSHRPARRPMTPDQRGIIAAHIAAEGVVPGAGIPINFFQITAVDERVFSNV